MGIRNILLKTEKLKNINMPLLSTPFIHPVERRTTIVLSLN